MLPLALAALVGVVHVHHEPSHDSDAPFSEVIAAAHGAGLGLALVKWIVDRHGGSIAVESRAGEGSVFIVRLPFSPAAALPILEQN